MDNERENWEEARNIPNNGWGMGENPNQEELQNEFKMFEIPSYTAEDIGNFLRQTPETTTDRRNNIVQILSKMGQSFNFNSQNNNTNDEGEGIKYDGRL